MTYNELPLHWQQRDYWRSYHNRLWMNIYRGRERGRWKGRRESDCVVFSVVLKMAQLLGSHSDRVRATARKTLSGMAIALGSKYLPFILKELKHILTKGFKVWIIQRNMLNISYWGARNDLYCPFTYCWYGRNDRTWRYRFGCWWSRWGERKREEKRRMEGRGNDFSRAVRIYSDW